MKQFELEVVNLSQRNTQKLFQGQTWNSEENRESCKGMKLCMVVVSAEELTQGRSLRKQRKEAVQRGKEQGNHSHIQSQRSEERAGGG